MRHQISIYKASWIFFVCNCIIYDKEKGNLTLWVMRENIKKLPDCDHYEIYQESASHYSVHLVYLPIIHNVSRIMIQNISL